jgi:hypothetical protein
MAERKAEYIPREYELALFNSNCIKEALVIKLPNSVIRAMPEIITNCFGTTANTKVFNLLKTHKLSELKLDERHSGGEYRAKLFIASVITANHKGFVNTLSDYIKWIKELSNYPIYVANKLGNGSRVEASRVGASCVILDQDEIYTKNTFSSLGEALPPINLPPINLPPINLPPTALPPVNLLPTALPPVALPPVALIFKKRTIGNTIR